jgi:hypothetical protein
MVSNKSDMIVERAQTGVQRARVRAKIETQIKRDDFRQIFLVVFCW